MINVTNAASADNLNSLLQQGDERQMTIDEMGIKLMRYVELFVELFVVCRWSFVNQLA